MHDSLDRAMDIRHMMPWVTEQEQDDLTAKIEETKDWIEKRMAEQEGRALTEEPAFTMDQVDKEMEKLNKLAKKIFGKKQPKEKKKPKKEETENEEAKAEEETDATAGDDSAAKDESA